MPHAEDEEEARRDGRVHPDHCALEALLLAERAIAALEESFLRQLTASLWDGRSRRLGYGGQRTAEVFANRAPQRHAVPCTCLAQPVTSGVFFQFTSEGLTFVATDAHKLVRYVRKDILAPSTAEFILPKKPLNLLKNTIGNFKKDIKITYTDQNATFEYGEVTLICRLIDGKYPNFQAVIPQDNPNHLVADRSALLSSVKRISIFSNKTTHQVKLKIAGNELNISAEDLDFSNKASERLTCNYTGTDIEIGFNSRFLIEMLNNLESEEVIIELSAPNRAGILLPDGGLEEGEEVLMLVMPVMLNS